MPSTAIVCGVLLILSGVIGYAYGFVDKDKPASLTALIPAVFGIILVALGAAARAKDNLRKHLMHAALLVALLGVLAIIVDFARTGWKFEVTAPVISKISMALVCLLFVILGVKSFIDARRGGAI